MKVKAPDIQAKYATAMAEREAARKQKNRKRDQEAAIQRAVDDQAKANKIAKLKGGGGGQRGNSTADLSCPSTSSTAIFPFGWPWTAAKRTHLRAVRRSR